MKKEKSCEVGEGDLIQGLWGVERESITEMAEEGIDESCRKVVGGEVRFKVSRTDVGNLGGNVVADAEEFDREGVRDGWGCSKGGTEAVACTDDGSI